MNTTGMDKECIALCTAINQMPGIRTVESCCGHGEKPYRIWFMADLLEHLPPLLYWFDSCHNGFPGWKVIAYTDCGMSPVRFLIEGPTGAYEQAERIAELVAVQAEEENHFEACVG